MKGNIVSQLCGVRNDQISWKASRLAACTTLAGGGEFHCWLDLRRGERHRALTRNRARFKPGGTGGPVRKESASRIIGAIAAAVIAIGTATCANAQTSGGMPNDASAQSQSIAASRSRNIPDSELARDVRRALSRTPNLHSTAIHVQARHGIVTLTGWVPQRAQVQRAGSVARSVRGVRQVNNRLNVRTRGASGH